MPDRRRPPVAVRSAAAAVLALLAASPLRAAEPVAVVEFYHAGFDHYFVSPLLPDIVALDSGALPGWTRTGRTFPALASPLSPFDAAVCRFYIPPKHGDSHFFSASAAECARVLANVGTDPNYSGYTLETPAAFYAMLPDPASGACPAPSRPVYRLWNARADSNHRYTTSMAIRAGMLARGYVPEGYGPDGVAMCVPAGIEPPASGTATLTSATPFAGDCSADGGDAYVNAEVEPFLAVHPVDTASLVAAWQQDRFPDGGAHGIVAAFSQDGGRTWLRRTLPLSRCAAPLSPYARASDPWVAIGPDGTAHLLAIVFAGQTLQRGSSSAVVASRSTDGGATWTAPTPLIADGSTFFNDKGAITADPTDARFVYAAWDRLTQDSRGPSWLARSTDGGATWEPARAVYDPGTGRQTLNNQVVVLADGTALLLFSRLDNRTSGAAAPEIASMRSTDHGATWSDPATVATMATVGTRDPGTGRKVRDASTLFSVAANGQRIALAWQDARFGDGTRDGIAFARSLDGGATWSAPAGINAVPAAAAFVPAVAIRNDGTIGVTYYDFRDDTADPATLATGLWFTQSRDGVAWSERRVAGPFDLGLAPVAEGLFLGDYQGLVAAGSRFVAVNATASDGALDDRTDVHAAFLSDATTSGKAQPAGIAARLPHPLPDDDATRQRLRDAVADAIARRVVGTPPRPGD